MEARPKLKIELTPRDKLVETIGWITLISLWTLVVFNYTNLPDTIPIHFKVTGLADNYGPKGSIFILPTIGTILFVGMTILNKFPRIFNYPTEITADNAVKQYTNATRMIRYLKLASVLIFLVKLSK